MLVIFCSDQQRIARKPRAFQHGAVPPPAARFSGTYASCLSLRRYPRNVRPRQ
jgi:hypothetical protein